MFRAFLSRRPNVDIRSNNIAYYIPKRNFTPTIAEWSNVLINNWSTINSIAFDSTFYGLLTANLLFGAKLLNQRQTLPPNVKGSNYGLLTVSIASLIKSSVYSYFWYITWPYALSRAILLPRVNCTLIVPNNFHWRHNYNGLVPYFIPIHSEIVISDKGEEYLQLSKDNQLSTFLIVKVSTISYRVWLFLQCIFGRFF